MCDCAGSILASPSHRLFKSHAYFLVRLKCDGFLRYDFDSCAGAWVAASASCSLFCSEYTETTELDSVAFFHCAYYLMQENADNSFKVTLIEVRAIGVKSLHQFGLEH